MAELQALLARTIEGVSFFLLLIDHRIGELISQWVYRPSFYNFHDTDKFTRTDDATQKLIDSMTFEELITGQNGVVASRALVNVIIDQQIGQQIAVSNTAQLLRRCSCVLGRHYQRHPANSLRLILQYRRRDAIQGLYCCLAFPSATTDYVSAGQRECTKSRREPQLSGATRLSW